MVRPGHLPEMTFDLCWQGCFGSAARIRSNGALDHPLATVRWRSMTGPPNESSKASLAVSSMPISSPKWRAEPKSRSVSLPLGCSAYFATAYTGPSPWRPSSLQVGQSAQVGFEPFRRAFRAGAMP
jgi:hypothetical protein